MTSISNLRKRAKKIGLKLAIKTHSNGWVGCNLYEFNECVNAYLPVPETSWGVNYLTSLQDIEEIMQQKA